ncbi:hypothetical protein HANVADRAFT_8358, partial [Hanseniaspora valbyensis NRRL Y-1626]
MENKSPKIQQSAVDSSSDTEGSVPAGNSTAIESENDPSRNSSFSSTTRNNSETQAIELATQKNLENVKTDSNSVTTGTKASTGGKNWRRQKEKGKNIVSAKTKKTRNPNFLCKVKYDFGYLFDVTHLKNGTGLKYTSEESSAIAIKALQKRFPEVNPSIKISKNYVCPHMKYNNKNVCFISDRQTALKEHLLTHGDCYYKCPKCNLKICDKKTGLDHCINVCKVIKNDNELSQLVIVDVSPKVLENFKKHDPFKFKALNASELQVALLSVKRKNGFPLPLGSEKKIDTSILKNFCPEGENESNDSTVLKTPSKASSKNFKKQKTKETSKVNVVTEESKDPSVKLDSELMTTVPKINASTKPKLMHFRAKSNSLYNNADSLIYYKNDVNQGSKIDVNEKNLLISKKSNENTKKIILPSLKFLATPKTSMFEPAKRIQPVFSVSETEKNMWGMELLLKATECLEYNFNYKKVMYVKYPDSAARV